MCDIFSKDISRAGLNDFYKVDKQAWSTVISSYPVRPGAVTKVTVYLVKGSDFIIGCGKVGDFSELRNHFAGLTATSVGYQTWYGSKYNNND
jgi:hypothetical protein